MEEGYLRTPIGASSIAPSSIGAKSRVALAGAAALSTAIQGKLTEDRGLPRVQSETEVLTT